MAKRFAQRGIIHAWANPDGTQKIEDKGPFGRERQRTLDSDVLIESKRFITDAVKAKKPFFVWHNTTRMHYWTNLSPKHKGKSGYGATIYGSKAIVHADKYGGYGPLVDEVVRFFKTGKVPLSAEETIEIFAFMSAADVSKANGGEAVLISDVIEQAKNKNMKRKGLKHD